MGETGTIFDIQRFSVHDGPGIRTTVFFKGCPLRCAWCANPESQERLPQLLLRDSRCTACGRCLAACPERALRITKESRRRIAWKKCTQCLRCVEACETGALSISGREATVGEIVNELERDRAFYESSGGGVTLSGGEPLLQPEFAVRLLARCREAGLHTALDTSGCADPDVLRAVIAHADLVLYDIKTLDDGRHRACTGVGNALILDNAGLAASRVRTWFRVPLVAGVNDGEDEIRGIAALARELGVEQISLLPYHPGGRDKNRQIGRRIEGFQGRRPTDRRVERLRRIVEAEGVASSIGR
ncbi:MAG TPA: glycyl-radical enzyme activating protein [Syntrophales bacterium]|nr:glycyl-radical enzyme activating protein [Syntrophales bacterium]